MSVELPSMLINWGSLIGFVIVAGSIVYFQWKNQTTKLLREQVNDMSKRIDFLAKEVQNLQAENGKLQQDYTDVKFKKNYLKQIVIEALATKKGISESLLEEISDGITLKPKKGIQ